MDNFFILDSKEVIPLIGAQSYSTGDGLELSQKYGYDYSKSPQSLTHRKRNTALTATIQATFNPVLCAESDIPMMDYISRLEHLTGKKIEFYWNRENVGSFVIQSVQFSGSVDTIQVFSQMAVSIAMTEGFIRRENLTTAVKTV